MAILDHLDIKNRAQMSAGKIIKLMTEKEVDYVDLRFTDPRGKLQHLTMDGKMVDEKMLNEGVFFDG